MKLQPTCSHLQMLVTSCCAFVMRDRSLDLCSRRFPATTPECQVVECAHLPNLGRAVALLVWVGSGIVGRELWAVEGAESLGHAEA